MCRTQFFYAQMVKMPADKSGKTGHWTVAKRLLLQPRLNTVRLLSLMPVRYRNDMEVVAKRVKRHRLVVWLRDDVGNVQANLDRQAPELLQDYDTPVVYAGLAYGLTVEPELAMV